jgi:hypothetical protein
MVASIWTWVVSILVGIAILIVVLSFILGLRLGQGRDDRAMQVLFRWLKGEYPGPRWLERVPFVFWIPMIVVVAVVVLAPLFVGAWLTGKGRNQFSGKSAVAVSGDKMNSHWFNTVSGRSVRLTGLHIRGFGHGFLEGRASLIRETVLAELPEAARKLFPGNTGVFVSACSGSANEYPRWIYFCELESSSPVSPDGDCSSLVVVWFAHDMNQPIPEFIASRIGSIDWEAHAKDGWY